VTCWLTPRRAHAPALPRGARLVYPTDTNPQDVTPCLAGVLEREALRVAVLNADTVAAERWEEWLAARVRSGLDVLITNPRIVQTGPDSIDFPSLAVQTARFLHLSVSIWLTAEIEPAE
jgi:hypothetical protein